MSGWKRLWWLILIALAFIAYSNSFSNGWHFEDFHSIVHNEHIRQPTNVFRFFTDGGTSSNSSLPALQSYQPLVLLGQSLTYCYAGYSLWWWHLVQVLLHSLFICLVFLFFRELTCQFVLSMAAAVLVALHPINSQTLNYFSARGEMQTAIFTLICLLSIMHLEARAGKKARVYWQLISLAALTAALFSGESAIVIPLLIVLWDWLMGPGAHEQRGAIGAFKRAIPHFFILALYMLLRKLVLGYFLFPPALTDNLQKTTEVTPLLLALSTTAPPSLFDYLLLQMHAILRYFSLMIIPWGYSPIHELTEKFALTSFIVLPAVVSLLFRLVKEKQERPLFSFCGLFFFVCLIPSIFIPQTFAVVEQRVYLAGVVIILALTQGVLHLGEKLNKGKYPRLFALLAVSFVFFVVTQSRNSVWRNEMTLWADGTEKAPTCSVSHWLYGEALINKGFLEQGVWQLEEAQKFNKGITVTHLRRLVSAHLPLGNLLLADSYVKAALTKEPQDVQLLEIQGQVLEELKSYDEALSIYRSLRKRVAWKADIREKAQKLEAKVAQLRRSVELAKRKGEKGLALARTLAEAGFEEQAIVTLANYLKEEPKSVEALAQLGWLMIKTNRCIGAIKYLEKAKELAPTDRQILARLVLAYGGAGKRESAATVAREMEKNKFKLSLQVRAAAGFEPY